MPLSRNARDCGSEILTMCEALRSTFFTTSTVECGTPGSTASNCTYGGKMRMVFPVCTTSCPIPPSVCGPPGPPLPALRPALVLPDSASRSPCHALLGARPPGRADRPGRRVPAPRRA